MLRRGINAVQNAGLKKEAALILTIGNAPKCLATLTCAELLSRLMISRLIVIQCLGRQKERFTRSRDSSEKFRNSGLINSNTLHVLNNRIIPKAEPKIDITKPERKNSFSAFNWSGIFSIPISCSPSVRTKPETFSGNKCAYSRTL